MEYGLSSACFYPMDTFDTLEIISNAGFNTIEIFANAYSECTGEGLKKLKELKNRYNLNVYSFHPFTGVVDPYMLFSGYKRRFDDTVELYKRLFEAAKELGAEVFNFHGDYKDVYSTSPAQYAEVYKKLFEEAKAMDLKFAQENVSRCKCGYIDYLKELKNELNDEIYFTLDLKQAIRAKQDIFKMIELMEKNIVNYHISDSDKERDCLLPTYGTADLSKINKAISKYYNGPAIVEVYSNCYSSTDIFKQLKTKLF
ncbi:MAG: sugar phosphate isomerase/epimerase [Ruminococcaceae bacterium]|nr:sugar phosphate isomerase/epimerase [Oscillospiraceae bacterium]